MRSHVASSHRRFGNNVPCLSRRLRFADCGSYSTPHTLYLIVIFVKRTPLMKLNATLNWIFHPLGLRGRASQWTIMVIQLSHARWRKRVTGSSLGNVSWPLRYMSEWVPATLFQPPVLAFASTLIETGKKISPMAFTSDTSQFARTCSLILRVEMIVRTDR